MSNSSDVEVRKSGIQGTGLFARREFKAGEVVLQWKLEQRIDVTELSTLDLEERKYLHPLAEHTYAILQPPERFVNHSCNNNTVVKNLCDVAVRDIQQGEEITSDYSSSDSGDQSFLCACGAPNCRKFFGRNTSSGGQSGAISTSSKVLETDRLILRRLSVEDAEFIFSLLNEPSFLRYIGDKGVRTIADARDYILQGPIRSYESFGFGLYLAELKNGGIPIGICGLLKRESLADVDIGFAFLPQFWKQGYAFESASAVMAHGRDDIGLKRIVAITDSDNKSSIKVLGKLGLRFERMIRMSDDALEIKLFASDI